MPEDTNITNITEDELTVQDILDEAQVDAPYHTILEIWREVIRPAADERYKKITPQWANRIVSAYREIGFQDMPVFKESYFDKIEELRVILELEIAADDECLNLFSAEEDVEHNASHYLNVIVDWQKAFLQWELDWNCSSPTAATDLAAISEVHRMFFDQTGLINLLDQINFVITDDDKEMLATTLQEMKDQEEQ